MCPSESHTWDLPHRTTWKDFIYEPESSPSPDCLAFRAVRDSLFIRFCFIMFYYSSPNGLNKDSFWQLREHNYNVLMWGTISSHYFSLSSFTFTKSWGKELSTAWEKRWLHRMALLKATVFVWWLWACGRHGSALTKLEQFSEVFLYPSAPTLLTFPSIPKQTESVAYFKVVLKII